MQSNLEDLKYLDIYLKDGFLKPIDESSWISENEAYLKYDYLYAVWNKSLPKFMESINYRSNLSYSQLDSLGACAKYVIDLDPSERDALINFAKSGLVHYYEIFDKGIKDVKGSDHLFKYFIMFAKTKGLMYFKYHGDVFLKYIMQCCIVGKSSIEPWNFLYEKGEIRKESIPQVKRVVLSWLSHNFAYIHYLCMILYQGLVDGTDSIRLSEEVEDLLSFTVGSTPGKWREVLKKNPDLKKFMFLDSIKYREGYRKSISKIRYAEKEIEKDKVKKEKEEEKVRNAIWKTRNLIDCRVPREYKDAKGEDIPERLLVSITSSLSKIDILAKQYNNQLRFSEQYKDIIVTEKDGKVKLLLKYGKSRVDILRGCSPTGKEYSYFSDSLSYLLKLIDKPIKTVIAPIGFTDNLSQLKGKVYKSLNEYGSIDIILYYTD